MLMYHSMEEQEEEEEECILLALAVAADDAEVLQTDERQLDGEFCNKQSN